MPEGNLRIVESEKPRVCAANIQPLMQTLLATLADIDFEHEREIEKVRNSPTNVSLKAKIINRLEQRHREKRSPYVHELMNLESQMQEVLGRSDLANSR